MNDAPTAPTTASQDLAGLADDIRRWGGALGFDAVRIADVDMSQAQPRLLAWLAQGRHGQMDYMAKHAHLRAQPDALVPGTLRVITTRLPYLHRVDDDWRAREMARLSDPQEAVISVYARGRDYHKVARARLQKLATRIAEAVAGTQYRVFTDSAPVLEVELARKAGLGWRGKHTLLLSREAGSMFFLGEIFVNLPLPVDPPETEHCGACRRCIDACPTGAIVAPYELDARRCISYLTIELREAIPEPLRAAIGNRIYGCDDCQLVCPWNKYAQATAIDDFTPRHGLDTASLLAVFAWTEADFDDRMAGSPIRRIGYAQWLRNIAVALGNALRVAPDETRRAPLRAALAARANDASALVREHVAWALAQEFSAAPSSRTAG